MKRPKERIKRVFAKKLENGGKPLGQIMREEGYADNTADNPLKVTQTKSWEILLEEYLPDDLLTKVAKEGLNLNSNNPIRQRYLETALKMKGKITEKKELKIKSLKGLVSVIYGEKD